MNEGPRFEVRAADGRIIETNWVYEDAADYAWERDREHWPKPMLPMESYLFVSGVAGADRAWGELDMVPPPMFWRFQLVGPFLYARETMYPEERLMQLVPRWMQVAQQHGGALAFWKTYCEPRIQQACDELAAMDGTTDLAAASELMHWGFHQTFVCLPSMFVSRMGLGALLTAAGVDDVELTSHEVTQGGANATQDIDAEIWALAELARANGAISDILRDKGDGALGALRQEPAARTFVTAFDALIARHGRRAKGWQLGDETWAERPEAALALVRAQVTSDRTSPDELRARSEARRAEATARVLAQLPPEKHPEFHAIVEAQEGMVHIREGRAYWQMVLIGEMRRLVLRVGAELVRHGRVDAAEDALLLTPDDIGTGIADLRARVAENREAWTAFASFEPPSRIGTPDGTAAGNEARGADLRGAPASRGVVTAQARVLHTPEEGHRLQPGEVLVCVQTTPAWTPLFAIAGAVVTETGGPLSHPAITAREYGIPAVLALEGATELLRDGQVITVDGGTGVVTIG